MKAVIVFCEGRHDIVFVQRSLGACGACKWMGGAVRDLPSPFGTSPKGAGLIAQRMKQRTVEDVTLSAAVSPSLPHFASVLELPGENTIFVLVRTHGKGQWEPVVDLLQELDLTIGQEADAGTFDVGEYAAAFVFDANDAGVDGTLAEFRAKYAGHFGDLSNARHGEWTATTRAVVGCFVVHGENGRGTLEDHLDPMGRAAWPELYGEARKFIDRNMRSGHAVWQNGAQCTKAVLTAAGQFECPGEPLSVVIGRKGLPEQQFKESLLSQALTRFLTGIPWGQDGPADGESTGYTTSL